MNVLIIGENRCNDHIKDFFAKKGNSVVLLPEVHELRSLSGEIGNFTAHYKADNKKAAIKSDIVIITAQPAAEPPAINGLLTNSIYPASIQATQGDGSPVLPPAPEPIVFLLDYINESPMSATIYALHDAAALARNKRHVYYLSKFVRTAGRGIETRYNDAREAGVTFIKYEDMLIKTDLDDEIFSINVSDGETDLEITTKTVFADGGYEVGEQFSYITEKLNLTPGKSGYLTEDRFFLTPALTSRRGVYHLTRDLTAERLDEGLDFIYNHAIAETRSLAGGEADTAAIDGQKCAFCYNCYRACPHAALEPDSGNNQMQSLKAACAGCGICVSICPANAITFEKDAANKEIGGNKKISGINDIGEIEKPEKTLIISCENSVTIEENLININDIEFISLACGGLIDMEKLSGGLKKYDKIMSVVCPNDACRHFDGNKRACAQTKRLSEMMKAAGLSADKLYIAQISQAMPEILREELRCLRSTAAKQGE